MPRLIDADRFWEDIALAPDEWAKGRTIKGYLDSAPTIDAEPVRHGRWIRQDDTFTKWQCAACGSRYHDVQWNFCPNCGAKMDGKDIDVPANPEPLLRPEECVNYATRTSDGKAVCMGTRELERCEGAGCKRWKAKGEKK